LGGSPNTAYLGKTQGLCETVCRFAR
jgi:hypothetical protein